MAKNAFREGVWHAVSKHKCETKDCFSSLPLLSVAQVFSSSSRRIALIKNNQSTTTNNKTNNNMKFSTTILALLFPLAMTFAQDASVEQRSVGVDMLQNGGALRGTYAGPPNEMSQTALLKAFCMA
jgi:hypothetical protein